MGLTPHPLPSPVMPPMADITKRPPCFPTGSSPVFNIVLQEPLGNQGSDLGVGGYLLSLLEPTWTLVPSGRKQEAWKPKSSTLVISSLGRQ